MLYNKIIEKTPVDKGWSQDKKYCAVTEDGHKYLLRISSMDQLERKKWDYEKMCEVAQLGIPMCVPVEFGTYEDGVYALHTWIDGTDAESTILALDGDQQYQYGWEAGRMLAKIHTISAPAEVPDWESRFNAKIDRNLAKYHSCGLEYEKGGREFVQYIAQNRPLLHGRPQSYQHGDYHIGNMMVDRKGVLTIIDFDRNDVGDPWEEFNRIVWSAQAAPGFASGMVDGYFDGPIPMDFWRLLALYICSNTLGSLPWAIPFGADQVEVMQQQAAQVLEWYDGMNCVVPRWYRRK